MITQLPVSQQFLFPVWALPEKIRAAVDETIIVSQAPSALVASSALAAASLAVQTEFDVKRMSGLTSPCSLYFITIAESGERKTTVDGIYCAPFREFEALSDNRAAEDGIANVKKVPGSMRILYSDATPGAFVAGLSKNSRSAGLWEDEASRIFSSRLVDDLGLLNKCWSGSVVTVDRRHESLCVRDPRCTISWMVQPAVFSRYMERKGDDARGIGFLARCLVSYPLSTQGGRFIRGRPDSLAGIDNFKQQVLQLLKRQTDLFYPKSAETNGKVLLCFSTQAQVEWENIYNTIEYLIGPGGEFCNARDYASKVAENVARLAGVFHAFEGNLGTEISIDTLRSASEIVFWYVREFIRLFSPPGPQEVISGYARLLDLWLIEYVRTTGKLIIHRNDLLQLGPNKLRSSDILNIAVERLAATNRLVCTTEFYGSMYGKRLHKGTRILYLNDAYYGMIARKCQPYQFEQL